MINKLFYRIKRTLFLLFVSVIAVFLPLLVFGQSNQTTSGDQAIQNEDNIYRYRLHEKIPGQENVDNLQSYLEALYKFGIAIVGILAVVMIGVGAFMYIVTAAGNLSKMTNAKDIITNAVFGLVMALVAWLILHVINPDLVGTTLRGPAGVIQLEAYVGDGQPDPTICRNANKQLYQMGSCTGNKACVGNECRYLIEICLHGGSGASSNVSEDDRRLAESDLCQNFFAKPGDFCGSIANGGSMLGRCTGARTSDCPSGQVRVTDGVQCSNGSICCANGGG